jgi:hypothetical protein
MNLLNIKSNVCVQSVHNEQFVIQLISLLDLETNQRPSQL